MDLSGHLLPTSTYLGVSAPAITKYIATWHRMHGLSVRNLTTSRFHAEAAEVCPILPHVFLHFRPWAWRVLRQSCSLTNRFSGSVTEFLSWSNGWQKEGFGSALTYSTTRTLRGVTFEWNYLSAKTNHSWVSKWENSTARQRAAETTDAALDGFASSTTATQERREVVS